MVCASEITNRSNPHMYKICIQIFFIVRTMNFNHVRFLCFLRNVTNVEFCVFSMCVLNVFRIRMPFRRVLCVCSVRAFVDWQFKLTSDLRSITFYRSLGFFCLFSQSFCWCCWYFVAACITHIYDLSLYFVVLYTLCIAP